MKPFLISPHRLTFFISMAALLTVIACAATQPFTRDSAGGDQTLPLHHGQEAAAVDVGEPTPPPDGEETGFTLTLEDGQAQPQAAAPVLVAPGEPLTDADLARVLARLPELGVVPGQQQDFRLPDEVLPPPRPGETVAESFPPTESAQPMSVESGPLEVRLPIAGAQTASANSPVRRPPTVTPD